MAQTILISQVPLPYSQIGSWTTLYHNYLIDNPEIDYIVCEKPETLFPKVKYSIVENTNLLKIQKKFSKNKYLGYFKALEKILKEDDKFIIQIIDNFGIVKPLIEFLEKKGKRNKCYLQFFYHGFPPFYENFSSRWFFEVIQEMVLLTKDSYKVHKEYYTVMPTKFSVLHNGIDTSKFYKLTAEGKGNLKKQLGVSSQRVFVWCSQDRPKKGLHILLDAWKKVYETRQDIVLWVIGCEPKDPVLGVKYLGKIPNNELPKYYQASDCYLFPTLWHEGFGMSLVEALHSGSFCIASANGGVPEVLQYGKLGKLIVKPNFVEEWENAILEFLANEESPSISFSKNLYSSKNWNLGMNKIIENAKKSIQ